MDKNERHVCDHCEQEVPQLTLCEYRCEGVSRFWFMCDDCRDDNAAWLDWPDKPQAAA